MSPFPRPAHVLVTGADGKLGRAVVGDLSSRGVRVTGLSLAWTAPHQVDRAVIGDATVEADVSQALAGVDAVVHLAAIAHRDAAPPYEVYRTNTDATFNVLAQAGAHGIARAVIASSINAFGVPMHRKDLLPAYYPIDEDIPVVLDDWYSLSKRSDELTAEMAASRWGMTVIALRFPHVGNPQDVRAHARENTHQQVREGWSYLDLRDAVRAVWAGLTADIDQGAHVIGVSADDTCRPEASSELLDAYAPDVPRLVELDDRVSLINTARARQLLGFEPLHSARIGDIADTAELT